MTAPDAAPPPLRGWLPALMAALERDPVVVRVMLAAVRGSAPRESGVSMLVAPHHVEGTIGGGQLEWQAVAAARELLDEATPPARVQRFVLGADLGQCCGGVVEVWMERYTRAGMGLLEAARLAAQRGTVVFMSVTGHGGIERRVICSVSEDGRINQLLRTPRGEAAPRLQRGSAGEVTLLERLDDELPPLWLYGAGHVGQALARILTELPISLTWIDSRAGQFPAQIPGSVRVLRSDAPVDSVATAPADARFLVMTHSHALDYALCRAILGRGDFAFAGVIGSSSKAARFRSRLSRDGVGADRTARLVCPIGIDGIASKWPAAIAVAVAAQVMQDISACMEPGNARRLDQQAATACAQASCAGCGAPVAESA